MEITPNDLARAMHALENKGITFAVHWDNLNPAFRRRRLKKAENILAEINRHRAVVTSHVGQSTRPAEEGK